MSAQNTRTPPPRPQRRLVQLADRHPEPRPPAAALRRGHHFSRAAAARPRRCAGGVRESLVGDQRQGRQRCNGRQGRQAVAGGAAVGRRGDDSRDQGVSGERGRN
ncbi:hypothetical protein PWT90_04634 [Aphanocladium album]|nr:hypothetical protein PWT90_04634 [Aphanocladium album]